MHVLLFASGSACGCLRIGLPFEQQCFTFVFFCLYALFASIVFDAMNAHGKSFFLQSRSPICQGLFMGV
jgi:hypothetical protein